MHRPGKVRRLSARHGLRRVRALGVMNVRVSPAAPNSSPAPSVEEVYVPPTPVAPAPRIAIVCGLKIDLASCVLRNVRTYSS